jgi:hypothetical protein
MTLEPQATAGRQEDALVTVGDIVISRSWLVTPVGTRRLAGTELVVTDSSRVESRIPAWAIVVAVTAFFFLLGLLFLLVRENRVVSVVQVTVRNGDIAYAVQVPVDGPAESQDVHARVAYARHLVAAAASD